MKHSIPFYNYTFNYKKNSRELKKIFHQISSKGAYILQSDLENFENEIKKYTKSKYVLGVGNATDGMQLFLIASGIKKIQK